MCIDRLTIWRMSTIDWCHTLHRVAGLLRVSSRVQARRNSHARRNVRGTVGHAQPPERVLRIFLSDTLLTKTIASTATLKIANIHSLDLFYTPIEERFERITRLARRALHSPVAAISLLNEDKQWFKSSAGWGISELPRDQAICKLTVDSKQIVMIGDTLADPRVASLPIVATAPRFRAYAGHPLADEQGTCVGTL